MSTIAWYKKQMENPELPTSEYLKMWNTLRELEFNAARTYHEGLARCSTMVMKSASRK